MGRVKKMRENHGVSLIELAIVMIIMIMIAAFAFFSGTNSIEKADATELYAEMTSLKNAVAGVMVQRELEEHEEEWITSYYDATTAEEDWYWIFGMNNPGYASSQVRKKLNMDSIKRDYLVNYETGDVKLKEPMEVLGSTVETYESVRSLVESDKI